MKRFGVAVVLALSAAALTPGSALAEVRTHGTYYDKINCERSISKVFQPSDPSRIYYCASNGGPASSAPTSWTLYSDEG